MPIDIVSSVLFDGPDSVPGVDLAIKYGPVVLTVAALKYYFGGSTNTWERDMHGKVFIMTGATSGVGAYLAYYLASKGAQLILLVRSTEDQWIIDYVEDLRDKTSNFMIYAEQCDLNSLHSIRLFATKWLDNKPARRLDGVLCLASESIPRGKSRQVTTDGVEKQIGVNYLGHYHLLTLLQPSLQVQPPDRDVRVAVATCALQALAKLDHDDLFWLNKRYPSNAPWKVYGQSKLLLGLFTQEYQRRLNQYERPDKAPCGVRINLVNPGIMRTPSTRRFLSMGSIVGLVIYLLLFPIWWIFFKNSIQGSQSFIFALCAPVFINLDGGQLIQECKILSKKRSEYQDEELQKDLFDETAKIIEKLEKQSAIERKKQELENLNNLPLKEKLKRQAQEEKKRANLHEKPESAEELDAKFKTLKKSLGIPESNPNDLEIPSFAPTELEEELLKTAPSKTTGQSTKSTSQKKRNKRKT